MTLTEAKKYIKLYCESASEISSWAVEGTISAKEALALKDEDTIINLAEDLQFQVRCDANGESWQYKWYL